jgi:hypothetical protein
MRETTGKLRVGPLRVSVSHGSWTFFDDDPADEWWMDNQFWKGGVKLFLDDLLVHAQVTFCASGWRSGQR